MKVLIVGLGSIARKHISALRKVNSNIQIFALRSGTNHSDEEGVKNIYDLSVIEFIEPDFIIISTPTSLHKRDISMLIKFGKPLFIEKPLAASMDIEEILPLVQNTPTYVACNLRFLDSLNYIRDNYVNNCIRINEVNSYCGSYLPDWRRGADYRMSYSSNKALGGGVHLDLIHELDYLYWLFGQPLTVNKILNSQSSLEIESIDYANYILDYKGFSASVILNYYRRDAKRYLELVCEPYTVYVDLLNNTVFENQIMVYQSKQLISDTYESQLRWFISNKLSGQNLQFNDINEAYKILKISLS